jgi:hypothetical protein
VSTDRDVTRIVQSWLEEGVTALPDRVLDAVLDQVPATRQRRSWWPARRLLNMNTRLRIVAALAAVVVVALIAINFAPKATSVGGPPATASPTAKPAPTPSPIALPFNTLGTPYSLNPGIYVGADPFPLSVTFTVPAGWEGNVGGPYAIYLDQQRGNGALSFTIFSDVYASPCHYKGLLAPPPGPAVDDLATALATLPGLTASTPTVVTVAGYQGKQLVLTAPASFTGCTLSPDGAFRIWKLPLGATNDLTPAEQDEIWILNIGGQRLVIDSPRVPGETAQETAEVQAVLDSVRIAPTTSSAASPTP